MSILAIDQGTTSTRAILVAPDGTAAKIAGFEHRQSYPRPGWVEHDALELLSHVAACIEAAPEGTKAVGIANQGESCLAWNRETGEPLGPVIVWQDERTADVTARLRDDGSETLTLARAGLPLDPYFSASKLGWIVANVPDAAHQAERGQLCLGTTDAFFRHRLTGRFETDIATASRTSLLSLDSCEWDTELCALFGVPVEALPKITPTHGELGTLPGGLPLAASIVDQQAALRGHECRSAGDAKITFGTGAFALSLAGAARPAAGRGPLPTIAWSDPGGAPLYALDGGVYAAGAAVNWARSLGLFSDWAEVSDFAGEPAISRGLAFVPALAGLACPHWDRRAKGAWMGMGLATSRLDLVQAVLEGIAFRAAEALSAMDAIAPIANPVSVDGGVTRSPWLCQFLADCLGRDIVVSDDPERTAAGVARLAAGPSGQHIASPQTGRVLVSNPIPRHWHDRFAAARRAVQGYGGDGHE